MDPKVLDITNKDVVLGLSWLTENGFSLDMPDRCLRNVNTSQLISSSVRWILEVLIVQEELLEDIKMLQIIDASKRYSRYTQWFSAKQVVKLPEPKSCNH